MSRTQPRLALPGGGVARPWTPSDAAALVLGHRDALVRHYASVLVDDVRTADGLIADWNRGWYEGTDAAWAIVNHGDAVVGSVRFGLRDAGLGLGTVGYWLDAEARGRGWATTALGSATRIVFARLGWQRVELSHAAENTRSCGVARRSGYLYEGLLRRSMRYPEDGRWSDEHLHARLAGDPVDETGPPDERTDSPGYRPTG